MRIQLRFFSVASLEFQVNLYAQYRTLKHEGYIPLSFQVARLHHPAVLGPLALLNQKTSQSAKKVQAITSERTN